MNSSRWFWNKYLLAHTNGVPVPARCRKCIVWLGTVTSHDPWALVAPYCLQNLRRKTATFSVSQGLIFKKASCLDFQKRLKSMVKYAYSLRMRSEIQTGITWPTKQKKLKKHFFCENQGLDGCGLRKKSLENLTLSSMKETWGKKNTFSGCRFNNKGG
jgi:hypothetical protein